VKAENAYDDDSEARVLRPGQSFQKRWALRSSFGWYDVLVEVNTDPNFLRRLAGHVENGRDSTSDPAFGEVGHRGRRWGEARSEQGVDAGMNA
jgi:phospholipase C